MTVDEWPPLYRLLCGGLCWPERPAQMRAFFDALKTYRPEVVEATIQRAHRKSWVRFAPTAGDLVEIAVDVMRDRAVTRERCEACDGSTWLTFTCEGVNADSPGGPALPINRAAHCGITTVHTPHDFGRRCRCFKTTEKEATP